MSKRADTEKGDAFLFYYDKWRGSRSVQRMSFAERGIFLEMMIEQWVRGSLPDDPGAVAEAIALTDAQRGEVEAAWLAMRQLYVTSNRDPSQIQNLSLERIRRAWRARQRKSQSSGRAGGLASASKAQKQRELSLKRPLSDPQANPSKEEKGIEGREQNEEKRETRALPRPHVGTVFDGSLPRDHDFHVFCDATFSICVHPKVHAKLINQVSRRFSGDRQQSHDALKAWYGEVALALPADFVMGDAFKFWQAQFDARWASAAVTVSEDQAFAEAARKGPSVRP